MKTPSLSELAKASLSLAQQDAGLWGKEAEKIARERLGWLELPERSRELLPTLDALAAWSRSVKRNRFVLSGMGGSSLAPEVIASTFGRELTLLDSTHPEDVRCVLDVNPEDTIFIISSKSGETIETLSHLKAITKHLEQLNLEPSEHIVVISDPHSPLSLWAKDHHIRHFAGDPTVGGRFSALSIFGLLPAALLGVDCATLLDDAADMKSALCQSHGESFATELAFEILENGPFLNLPNSPLSHWIEQLVAESSGKEGKGIIPVISERKEILPSVRRAQSLPLGAAFYLWEWTTSLLGYALGVNPFDQPDVASAKEATHVALNDKIQIDSMVIRKGSELLSWCEKVNSAPGYLALLCYLPMHNKELIDLANALKNNLEEKLRATGIPVTLGFGPRYLHSTGQCHKGGPDFGRFAIITLDDEADFPIPDANYSFRMLITAQALGDFHALQHIGRPVTHAHLTRDELKALVELSA